MCGQTYCCTFVRICLTWFRSWCTHSCSRSPIVSRPTDGPGPRDLGRVPGLESDPVALEQLPDAAGEGAPLGLDQVAERLERAPLLRRRVPAQHLDRQGAQLVLQVLAHRAQQRRYLVGRQRARRLAHRTRSV
jgi:hypothetical protein